MKRPLQDRFPLFSWLLYDFANSSFSAVVGAVVFPVYLVKHLAPTPTVGDIWWGRTVSISMLLVSITSPFMGGISDLSGYRKRFLILYTIMAIFATSLLSLSERYGFFWAVGIFCVANFFVEGAMVFYNAFLPEVAEKEAIGRVSGWGFGLGYLGSAISLLIALFFVRMGNYGMAFLTVGLFFLFFSLPSFFFLSESSGTTGLKEAGLSGLKRTIKTIRNVFYRRDLRLFILSYFFFRDGLNTVIAFSSIFAANTLGFSYMQLLWLYLLIQLTGMVGAVLFSWPTDYWGPKSILMFCLFVWTGICIWAYYVGPGGFWWLATTGGVFLGTTQATARAMFAGFIPKGSEGEYFGLYALVGKTSSVLGPLLFSTTVSLTGSERMAALLIGGLFGLAILLLLPVRIPYIPRAAFKPRQ